MSLLEKCREVADKPGCGYALDVAALARLVVEAEEIIRREGHTPLRLSSNESCRACVWLRKVEGE